MSYKLRQSIDFRVAAVNARLAEAQATYSQTALELAEKPDDKDLCAAIASLEATVTHCRTELARLAAASAAADCADTAAAKAERKNARHQIRHKQLPAVMAKLKKADHALLSYVEGLGPLLAARDGIAADYQALVRELVRAIENDPASESRRLWGQVEQYAATRRGAPAAALAAALWNVGLGRTGLELEPHGVVVGAPTWQGAFAKDPHAALDERFENDQSRMFSAIDRAASAIEKERGE